MSDEILKIRGLNVEMLTENGMVQLVRGVRIDLKEGEIHGIVGESGCGKTVTAKSVMRLHDERYTHYSGSIRFGDTDILTIKEGDMRKLRGSQIAYVFQNPMTSFDSLFTIGEQIAEGIRAHSKLSKKEAYAKAVELLESVGVTPGEKRAAQYPHEFSGGMLQRAMIAMSVSCDPKVLIADEATTALDVTMQARVLELLKKLRDEKGLSILCITHNFGVVAEICDTVTVMYAGHVAESGTVSEIFHSPKHPYTEELIKNIKYELDSGDEDADPAPQPKSGEKHGGCAYADKCKYAQDICFREKPPLRYVSDDHFAECHFTERRGA